MARFKITVPGGRLFTGEGAGGTKFRDGEATVDASTDKGRSALAYFHGAGYTVTALDDVTAESVIAEQRDGGRTALDEAAALRREIAELEAQRSIGELRRERDELYRQVHGHDRSEDVEAGTLTPGATVTEPAAPVVAKPAPAMSGGAALQQGEGAKLAPPQDSESVDKWREWAVASGRATAADVEKMPRADIIRSHGKAYDAERAAELDKGVQA